MLLTDKQINKLFKNKPEKAIKYLFDLYYVDLSKYAFLLVEKKEIAEEIAQGVFIYLWEKRAQVHFNSYVKSYLFKSVKNQSINFLKSKYSQIDFRNIDTEETSFEIDNVPRENFAELSELTKKAINSLPERCALIFKLSRSFNLSYKEIAEHLEISIKTVENQMTIALKRIREFLDNYWYNEK